jgi:Cadherin domain
MHNFSSSQIKYQASVRENSPRGTFVAQVSAMDKDSGQFGKISYSLAGTFLINVVGTLE